MVVINQNRLNRKVGAEFKSTSTENNLSLYLKEISKIKSLQKEDEILLVERIQQGSQLASNALVCANLKFVVAVCRKYQNQGMSIIDLIGEGNLGLIRAAKRFDVNKNCKFISYAVWWIRQSILQGMAEQSRTIKLPVNKIVSLYKIKKTTLHLEQKLGRSPNLVEISKASSIREEEVKNCAEINQIHIPLDNMLDNDDEVKLSDLLQDDSAQNAEETLLKNNLTREIAGMLNSLPRREREVLKLYFGIDMDIEYTLEEIGERFDLTRERVRQIKETALSRLKHVSRSRRLDEYKL